MCQTVNNKTILNAISKKHICILLKDRDSSNVFYIRVLII